jgi:hypothetical protein
MAYVLPFYLIIFGVLLFARQTSHFSLKTIGLLFVILLMACTMNSVRFINVLDIEWSWEAVKAYYTSGQTDAAIAIATQDMVKTYDDYSRGYVRQIIKLTQSDYDDLVQFGQPDPETFYIIVNSN